MVAAELYEDLPELGMGRSPVAARLERIWGMVEDIAGKPGRTRQQLAREYALSERQVQADLNLIRREMDLPLVRRRGYRFDPAETDTRLDLGDVALLLLVLSRALRDPGMPTDRIQSLIAHLPRVLPPHLRPLARVGLSESGRYSSMFGVLIQALVERSYVRLHYPLDAPQSNENPVVQPQVIFPYEGTWWLIGHNMRRGRLMAYPLEYVRSVSAGA